MFRIKICGVKHRADAVVAVALGADAIGLNFYEPSPRYLSPAFAGPVAAAIPSEVTKVGVFVNATAVEISRTFDRLRLDLIQLAGDEPPEIIAEVGDRPVMKAFRYGPDGLAPLVHFVERSRKTSSGPKLVLIDASQPGQYGGTGATVDWKALRQDLDQPELDEIPVVLAGGLNPENVAEAIVTVRPQAVDVASGVEYAPGRKDADLVQRFIASADAAFRRL